MEQRAARVTHDLDRAGQVRSSTQYRLDRWGAQRAKLQTGKLGYQQEADVTGLLQPPDAGVWELWSAPMSLREVEPDVLLQLNQRDASAEDAPAWTYDRVPETRR